MKSKTFLVAVFLVIFLVNVLPAHASHTSGDLYPDPMNPLSVLEWLSSAGAAIMMSWLAERWPWFGSRSKVEKFLMAVVMVVVSTAMVNFVPEQFWDMILPYWKSIANLVIVFAGQQVYHQLGRRRNVIS